MPAAVCTLIEGNYHYGLGGLSNSLYKNGFRGALYAGYRGQLPFWATEATSNNAISWNGAKTLLVNEGFKIHFVPVETNFHFANYKPDFMLKLLAGPAANETGLVYFDPDIVIKCKWAFYENWITHGVALVHEITANDMPVNNPIRREWQKVMESCGKKVTHHLSSYINSGFCGVSKENTEFLSMWSFVIKTAIKSYNFKADNFEHSNRTELFFAGDQDALNIAAMFCESPLSEIGPEGMDLIHGGFTMSHAIGSPKPWRKNYLLSAIKGVTPSLADKAFWLNVSEPINLYSSLLIKNKRLYISIASFISRFYRKL